ncbi:MAG: ACT domain-containing protein [Bacteroidetes bacterium]|nr:ACT domain-containing protein [Bacteroidota bacterium]
MDKANGETSLQTLLKNIEPIQQSGEFVFCSLPDIDLAKGHDAIMCFKEEEAYTLILAKQSADELGLHYSFIAGWITLSVHSSLEAVGLTAAFSKALSDNGISSNVVAAFYHDHIFVNIQDVGKAMKVLQSVSL